MSVLVYVENWDGAFKKASYEAVNYAAQLAQQKGEDCIAITTEASDDVSVLSNYGANKIIHVKGDKFKTYNNQIVASLINEVASDLDAKTIVLSNTNNGKNMAPMLSVKAGAALMTNVLDLPESLSPLKIKRKAFSNKAFVHFSTDAEKVVLALTPNTFGIAENNIDAQVEEKEMAAADSNLTSVSVDKTTGKIPLPEAELVISGGRGLKGPENWNMVEELANEIGAGTACSKPVADMGWRPHGEHVGQTGLAINPELYIAIGISGAIQHLAGVSASKNIVVINSDPEAPFFKAADYGIVGDAFDVVPKLIDAIKKYKAAN